jgi:cytochrome P450
MKGADPTEQEASVRIIDSPFGQNTYVVTGYDDAYAVLSDSQTYSNAFHRSKALGFSAQERKDSEGKSTQTFATDGPNHLRSRKIIGQSFTARRVALMRPAMNDLATELIQKMLEQGPVVDLNPAFAYPFPSVVSCQLLGAPESEQQHFRSWAGQMTRVGVTSDKETIKRVKAEMTAYFAELIERRRREPGDDLMSALINKTGDDTLTDPELQSMAQVILVAGHDTVLNQIGLGVVRLMNQRDLWDKMVSDPSVVPATVEEIFRLETINGETLPGIPRFTTREVEIGGVTIPAESIIWVDTAAANIDEAKFVCPHEFDTERQNKAHLSFGHGLHYCLGAQLARAQMQVALGKLAEMVPTLRLAIDPAELETDPTWGLRGYKRVPVTW